MTNDRVLFVDDEDHLRIVARQTFELEGIDIECFASADAALAVIDADFSGVIVTDIRMPGTDGVQFMENVLAIDADIPIILITGHGDIDLAVDCMKNGCHDFFPKPWQPERLVAAVRRAIAQRRLALENRALRAMVSDGASLEQELFGHSEVMQRVRQKIDAVATAELDVLITGDTGTGKEVAARMIHKLSFRSRRPFVHINCSALPESLIESELFGHEAGAFLGATRARYGKLEHARGGILCLDEIDSLSLSVQAKLLDVLHNRTVTRLGSNDPISLDIRVVALSKTDLEAAVERGSFRADLLYRLNVASIFIPSLSDRHEDIPGLFMLLCAQVAKQHGLQLTPPSAQLLSSLAARRWPGNVRQLRNHAELFVLGLTDAEGDEFSAPQTLAARIEKYEKAQIAATIAANAGKLRETYETLGLSRKTLYDKMKKYGLKKADLM